MNFQLDGKVALVTGASRGIGHAIANALAQAGAYVVGTATTQEGADKFSQHLDNQKWLGKGLVLNISQPETIAHLITEMEKTSGVADILVNNAAITRDNLLMRMKEEEWSDIIETNLNSVFRLTKAHLRDMLKKKWGRVINLTSIVAFSGNAGQANYAAAKAGIVGFSKALAQEVASRNITVNCVAPGFIDTDMTRGLSEAHKESLLQQIPMNRMGRVDEIASAVLFLASMQAGYITGQTLHVNGGMYMA